MFPFANRHQPCQSRTRLESYFLIFQVLLLCHNFYSIYRKIVKMKRYSDIICLFQLVQLGDSEMDIDEESSDVHLGILVSIVFELVFSLYNLLQS